MNKPFKKFNTFPKVERPHITVKKPDDQVISRLFSLVSEGDINKIRNAISTNNTTLDLQNEKGESLVHAAILSESKNLNDDDKYHLVEYLLSNGAPSSKFDVNNVTPLHIAAKQQNKKLIVLLIKHGSESVINHPDNQRMTPLHYAIQADIFPCQKKLKVKALIPLNDKKMTNDMKQLTVTIIDILNIDTYSQYIKSISNHIQNANKIDFVAFEKIANDSSKEIVNILATKNDLNQQSKIEKHGAHMKIKIKNELVSKLNSSIKPIDINPGYIDGTGPGDNVNDKVLPKNNYLLSIKDKIKNKKLHFDDYANTLLRISHEFENNINNCHSYIHQIIEQNAVMQHNRNIFMHGDKIDIPQNEIIIKYTSLITLLTHNDPTTLYLELRNVIKPPDHNIYKPQIPHKATNVVRGTKEMRNAWAKENVTPQLFSLTMDNGYHAVGSNTRDIITNALTEKDTKPDFDPNTLRTNQIKVDYGNINHYFTEKISMAVQRIKLHINAFNKNLKVLNNHISNNYYGKIYSDIIPAICVNMIDICQSMVSIEIEKKYINDVLSELKSKYNNLFRSNAPHPYAYSLEYALDHVHSINENLGNIYKGFSEMYLEIRKVYVGLNTVIDIINLDTTYQSITHLESTFHDKNTQKFNGLWDRTILHIDILPNTFDLYKNAIDYNLINFESVNSIENMRKLITEQYIPSVNPNSFGSFIIDTNNELTKDSSIDQINNKLTTFDKVYYVGPSFDKAQIDTNVVNLTIGDLSIPRTGFLIKPNLGAHSPLNVPFNGYGRDKNFELSGTIVDDNSNKLNKALLYIGNYGRTNSYNMAKMDAVTFNLGNNLDTYIGLTKYNLIQNIIQVFYDDAPISHSPKVKQEILDIKNLLLAKISVTQGLNSEENVNSILYTIIGKVADEIIVNHINHSINKSSIDISLHILKTSVSNADYGSILNSLKGKESTFINMPDTGFKLNFNVLFDDIISDFLSTKYPNNINKLTYGSITMQESIQQQPQEIIYDKNYNQINELKQNDCYNIDPSVIDILVNHGGRVNPKDISHMTPIFYAILQLNAKSVGKLIEHNAYVNTPNSKNDIGLTPLYYAIQLYKDHNKYLHKENGINYKDIMDRMYIHLSNGVTDELLSKSEFKNNIVENLDMCFPQLLIMLNNLLYYNMKSYIRKWSYNDQHQLCELMDKYKILTKKCDSNDVAILDLDTNEIINIFTKDTSFHVLSKQEAVMKNKMKKYKENIIELENQYNSFNEELTKEENKSVQDVPFINFLRKRRSDIHISIKNERKNLLIFEKESNNLDTNITIGAQNKTKSFEKNKSAFLLDIDQRYAPRTMQNKSSKNVTSFYKNIFNYVVNNTSISDSINKYTGYEDYKGYNELWKYYIASENKLRTIDNLHLSLIKLEDKLLNKINENKENIATISKEFNIIRKVHQNIITPFAQDYFEGSQDKLDENYALSDVINIITHIVRHVISSNMYLSIIKLIAKYVMSTTPGEKTDDGTDDMSVIFTKNSIDIRPEYISNIMDAVLKHDSSKLATYIIGHIPKMIVKKVLNVQSNDYDSVQELSSIKKLFEPIVDIISSNTVINSSNESILIKNINDYIFPYYEEVFVAMIPKLKIMTDNYCRLMINQSKYIAIINELLKKSSHEII